MQVNASCDPSPNLPDDVEHMAEHKFKIGQIVFFRPKLRPTDTPANNLPYRITQSLPPINGEPGYRIQFSEREFLASESELRPMKAFAARY